MLDAEHRAVPGHRCLVVGDEAISRRAGAADLGCIPSRSFLSSADSMRPSAPRLDQRAASATAGRRTTAAARSANDRAHLGQRRGDVAARRRHLRTEAESHVLRHRHVRTVNNSGTPRPCRAGAAAGSRSALPSRRMLPRGGRFETGQQHQRGGLAGTRRAQQGENSPASTDSDRFSPPGCRGRPCGCGRTRSAHGARCSGPNAPRPTCRRAHARCASIIDPISASLMTSGGEKAINVAAQHAGDRRAPAPAHESARRRRAPGRTACARVLGQLERADQPSPRAWPTRGGRRSAAARPAGAAPRAARGRPRRRSRRCAASPAPPREAGPAAVGVAVAEGAHAGAGVGHRLVDGSDVQRRRIGT